MNLQDFINRWNGRHADFDGYYGAQCVDLVQFYSQWLGYQRFSGDAWNIYDQPGANYTQIPAGQTPRTGDIAVWQSSLAGSGGAGHTSIVHTVRAGDFTSFDQNFPVGSVAHLQGHNYNKLRGFLRPKKAVHLGQEDIVKPTEAEVYDAFRRFSKAGKPANPDQVRHYMTHDVRELYRDLLLYEVQPKDPEIIQAFKDLQPWKPLNDPPYQGQSAYYAERPAGVMYRDLATGLKKKLDEVQVPATVLKPGKYQVNE